MLFDPSIYVYLLKEDTSAEVLVVFYGNVVDVEAQCFEQCPLTHAKIGQAWFVVLCLLVTQVGLNTRETCFNI